MARIKCFAISCSSDADLDARRLYVWGELKHAHWLPETKMEAKRRIKQCKKENKCSLCDAEIHEIEIQRNKDTKLKL